MKVVKLKVNRNDAETVALIKTNSRRKARAAKESAQRSRDRCPPTGTSPQMEDLGGAGGKARGVGDEVGGACVPRP